MVRALILPLTLGFLLVSCGSETKPAPAPAPAAAAKPARRIPDEYMKFPKDGLVGTKVVQEHLMGKTFMPGGTLATYKRGAKEFEMFLAETDSPDASAIMILDWKKALTDANFVPGFGGYSGKDGGKPVFVFPKGKWIGGASGLPEKEADLLSRTLAGNIR